ncbi:MAG: hypothetical protein Q6363_009105, partial [Candidatus Njordarchaeota archaeon]
IGAKKFEEVEGVRPDVLIVFSYTGKIPESVLEEAERCGVIVESSIRRLAMRIRNMSVSKK